MEDPPTTKLPCCTSTLRSSSPRSDASRTRLHQTNKITKPKNSHELHSRPKSAKIGFPKHFVQFRVRFFSNHLLIFFVGFLVDGASVLATHCVVDDDVTSTAGRCTSGHPSVVEEVDVNLVVKLFWLRSGAQHTLKTIFMLFVVQRPPIRRWRSSLDDVAETPLLRP